MLLNLIEGIFQLLAGTSNYDLFILNDKNSRKKIKMLELQNHFYQHTGYSGYGLM